MARIHFIVNPFRPSVGLRWPYEEKKIRELTKDFEVHLLRGRMHGELLARQAVEAGAELIVAVGGDSTLSEIVNGLHRAAQGSKPIPHLAMHPELQAGDFVRTFRPERQFLDLLTDFLAGKTVSEKVDLAEIEFTGDHGQKVRRVFINCAGFGFSSLMVDRLAKNYRLSRGRLSFLRLLTRLLPFFRHPSVTVKIDGHPWIEDVEILTGLVHNGRYAGHGLSFSPTSSVTDGKLEFTLIEKAFTLKYFFGIFPLFAGQLLKASFVKRLQAQSIAVESLSARRVRMDFDGDIWGYLPLSIRSLPSALEFLR